MTSVSFSSPPRRRGSGDPLDPHERELAAACRARPGHWALWGQFPSQPDAENLRRRIKRGYGAWTGGTRVWVVSLRKAGDYAWQVYVAYAPERDVAPPPGGDVR
jgi:hypothetical protein